MLVHNRGSWTLFNDSLQSVIYVDIDCIVINHTAKGTPWTLSSRRIWTFLRLWWLMLLSDHFCVLCAISMQTNVQTELITKQYATENTSEVFIHFNSKITNVVYIYICWINLQWHIQWNTAWDLHHFF